MHSTSFNKLINKYDTLLNELIAQSEKAHSEGDILVFNESHVRKVYTDIIFELTDLKRQCIQEEDDLK